MLVDVLSAFLANPYFLAFFVDAMTYAHFFFALRADQHHVRKVKGRFEFHNTGLNLAAARLTGFLMFLDNINALDNDALCLGNDAQHFATLSDVFSSDDFDSIALFNALHVSLTF
jgi:hypothetical protein